MLEPHEIETTEAGPVLPVIFHPHPFSAKPDMKVASEGMSVAQIVAAAKLPADYDPFLRVWIGDREIPRAEWALTKPQAGQSLYIRVVPGKSGKDVFRAVAMVVIAVVAFATGQWYAASVLGLQSGTMAFGIAAGLTAAAVSAVGMLALNALVPPPGFERDKGDQRYSLTGTQNQFAPYANIPRVLGKRRVFPLHAARPYSEIQGDDEYLRVCLVVGWGPLEITNIKIGETPISAFDGVQIETREGWANDPDLTLFSKTVTEESLSIELQPFGSTGYYPTGTYGYYGDYYALDILTDTYGPVTPAGTNGWAQRTTATNAVEFSVDVAFPQGLFRFDDKGRKQNATVNLEVQYRLVGSPTWTNAVWQNSYDEGFGTAGQINVTGAESSAFRRSGLVKLPAAGQYEVRMRRTNQNGGDKYVDLSWWSALRTIKADYPVLQKGLALIALRMKASGQLNGVPNTINCEAHSYLPVWDGNAWTYTKSSNPAWAYCDLLRRRNNETFISDDRIDLPAISAWASACAATAPNASEPRWTFNAVVEGGSVFENLRLVASNARANYTLRDGKHSIVRDVQQSVPVQHISPRNSWGYTGVKAFVDYPHALRVIFTNAEAGYQQDERLVYYDGYTAANATKFETLELLGCTSPTQAFREARYHMAVARLRPEEHAVQMDIEALRCTTGDLVLFQHDAVAIGIQSSRVRSITLNGSNRVSGITLDDDIYMETGKSYVLRGRQANGSTVLVSLANPGTGYYSTVSPVTPPLPAAAPDVGDLVMFGEASLESAPMLIKKIEPAEDFAVTVYLIDAQDGVYSADTGTIPAFNSYLTLPNLPSNGSLPPVYISTVRSDDSALLVGADGSITYRILVQLQQPQGSTERVDFFEVQWREANSPGWQTVRVERAQPFAFLAPVEVGKTYELRSRGVSDAGSQTEWSSIVTHEVLGKNAPPGVPTAFSAVAVSGGIRLAWTNPLDDDLWMTEVYENTTNNSATASLVATLTANNYTRLGLSAGDGVRYYWLKAVDTSGNKSAFSSVASATAANKALVVQLSNDAVSLSADSAGDVASFASAVGVVTVFDGETNVTASATLSASGSFCTGTVNTATDNPVAGQPKGYYRVTAMSASNATLTITATYNGQTVSKQFTLSKSLAGAPGSSGAAVSVNVSKAAINVYAFADGTVGSFSGADGQMTVFEGGTDVTGSSTLSASGSGVTVQINTSANSPVAGQPKGYYRITAMSADQGIATLTAVYGGVTYTRSVVVSKVKTGIEIVGALPGSNLFEGRVVFLSTDDKLYRYTGGAWTKDVDGSDLVAGSVTAAKIGVTELSALSANVGTLTAGLIRDAGDNFRVDISNGRTIAKTGGYMKVTGNPFGSANQFIEWYGPFNANLATCTEANAVYYLKTNGQAYFGGALLAGVLKNAAQGTVLNGTNTVELGPFSSNGNQITITASWALYGINTYPGNSTGLAAWNSISKQNPSAVIVLSREIGGGGYSDVVTYNVTGQWAGEAPIPADQANGYYEQSANWSATFVDPQNIAQPRRYKLRFTTWNVNATQSLDNILALQSIE